MVEGNRTDGKGKLKREPDRKGQHWGADSEDALKSLKLQILHIEGQMLKRVNIKIPDYLQFNKCQSTAHSWEVEIGVKPRIDYRRGAATVACRNVHA